VSRVPPSLTAPAAQKAEVRMGTEVAAMPWRFAVMSDAQFVARDPDSDLVAAARRTLREVKAVKPVFLLINGDPTSSTATRAGTRPWPPTTEGSRAGRCGESIR
jgi:hypothetical protein